MGHIVAQHPARANDHRHWLPPGLTDGHKIAARFWHAARPFTLATLKVHVETLDQERKDFGPDYQDHGVLFCWENGKPPHPDTITRRFKRLAPSAGLPEIDLHDVRHSYATAGRDAKIDWKALGKGLEDDAVTRFAAAWQQAGERLAATLQTQPRQHRS